MNGRESHNKHGYEKRQAQRGHSLWQTVRKQEVDLSEMRISLDSFNDRIEGLGGDIREMGRSIERSIEKVVASTDKQFDDVWRRMDKSKPDYGKWAGILITLMVVAGSLVAFKADSVIAPLISSIVHAQEDRSRLGKDVEDLEDSVVDIWRTRFSRDDGDLLRDDQKTSLREYKVENKEALEKLESRTNEDFDLIREEMKEMRQEMRELSKTVYMNMRGD